MDLTEEPFFINLMINIYAFNGRTVFIVNHPDRHTTGILVDQV